MNTTRILNLLRHSRNASVLSLRNCCTVLPCGCTSLHSHRPCGRVLFFPHSLAFIICRLFDDGCSKWCEVILSGVRWYLIVVLICLSLVIIDIEHLFMCLLAICMSPLEKHLFRSCVHFLIAIFVFLIWSYMSYLYIVEINPLWVTSLANIFFHSLGCLFVLFDFLCCIKAFKSLTRSHLFIFALFLLLCETDPKRYCCNLRHRVLPVFL